MGGGQWAAARRQAWGGGEGRGDRVAAGGGALGSDSGGSGGAYGHAVPRARRRVERGHLTAALRLLGRLATRGWSRALAAERHGGAWGVTDVGLLFESFHFSCGARVAHVFPRWPPSPPLSLVPGGAPAAAASSRLVRRSRCFPRTSPTGGRLATPLPIHCRGRAYATALPRMASAGGAALLRGAASARHAASGSTRQRRAPRSGTRAAGRAARPCNTATTHPRRGKREKEQGAGRPYLHDGRRHGAGGRDGVGAAVPSRPARPPSLPPPLGPCRRRHGARARAADGDASRHPALLSLPVARASTPNAQWRPRMCATRFGRPRGRFMASLAGP